jgi:glycosyltransferase involved in cell wall biosynthesis
MTRVLFVNQSGQLGGGDFCLLDIAGDWKDESLVALFSRGPLEAALHAKNISFTVLDNLGGTFNVRREDGALRAMLAIPRMIGLARKIARISKEYDLIYANSQKAFVVSALATSLVRKPIIWHLRDILNSQHFSSFNRWIVRFLANVFAKRVIANSIATGDAFIQAGGNKAKLIVIPDAIDHKPFEEIRIEHVAALRRELQLDGVPIIGYFSRISPWKGHTLVLEAMESLPDVHCLFVGAPLFGEQAYEDELLRTVKKLGLENRVHFLGFRSDIPELMRVVDIVVHVPLAPEPFGRILVEAMLAKRPIIATREGGALEIIEDNVSGLLIEPGNAQSLAHAVTTLLANRNLSDRLATVGHTRALVSFSLPPMLAQIRNVIHEVEQVSRVYPR